MNKEFDFEDVKSQNPKLIQLAVAKALTLPDDPKLPSRSSEKKIEDAEWGACGEIIIEGLGLKRHSYKYQDFSVNHKIMIDDCEIYGVVEVKVIREDSGAQLMLAIERHFRHSSADFVISLIGDRKAGKLYPHRITFCGNGVQDLKLVKRYTE